MSTAQLSLRELRRRPTSLGRIRPERGFEEYLAGLWAGGFVRGNVAQVVQCVQVFPQEGHWALFLPEEGLEMTWWGEPFGVAAKVEKPAKDRERRGLKPPPTVDEQSGTIPPWEPAINQADEAIRDAYDNKEPREALQTISRIWEHLDRVSELAAARSRLLMGKVAGPPLAETPAWFEKQEAGLRWEEEGKIPPNALAIETARLLVRAALASSDQTDDLEAEVDMGPLGRVAVEWQIPGLRLHWMVEATDLPWPSVKVYHVFRATEGGNIGPAKTQIFHNAFDAVEAFVGVLRRE